MAVAPAYRGIRAAYDAYPRGFREYFYILPNLLTAEFGEAALAYTFFKVEQSQIRVLYGGLIRLHRANADFAKRVLDREHVTRAKFKELFAAVYGSAFPQTLIAVISEAERVRDRLMHGRQPPPAEIRAALVATLTYAHDLDTTVHTAAGFHPCGDMRGTTGTRADRLDVRTTKWVMKGMGFSLAS